MSMRVPDEFIALLREKVDIVDVVSDYVKLKRAGRSLVGLCPFHSEKTASFHVTPSKGFYHCFGCGAGGTVITFLMEIEQIPFVQAVAKLAHRAGLSVPVMQGVDHVDERDKQRAELYRALDLAAKFYNHILMNHDAGTQGLSYFLGRDVSKKTIVAFSLGYAPHSNKGHTLVDFLRHRDVPNEVILEAGLGMITDSGEMRDRFRGRVMFPIWDLQGRAVAFGARTLGSETPKYLNSPDTSLFHKGHMLYGYHKARASIRRTGQVVLLEGYMDAIALHQSGFANAVATLGTALTPDQAGLLRRVAEEVILLYDGDQAGQDAALKSIRILKDVELPVKIARLPQGIDPDEWIRDKGATAFSAEILHDAIGALEYQLQHLTHNHPNHLTSGRLAYLHDAIGVVAQEESSIERESALKRLGETYAVSNSALREDLERQMRTEARRQTADKKSVARYTVTKHDLRRSSPEMAGLLSPKHEVAAQQLLTYMLIDVDVARQVERGLDADFSSPAHSALQAYLYAFYADHEKADPELFLSTVDDPQVLQLATRLLQGAVERNLGVQPPDRSLIQDYIQCVISYGVEQKLSRVAARMKEASIRSDFAAMREQEAEFRRLQRELADARRSGG